MPSYWIGVAVRDHVKVGERNGFAQLGHGKESALNGLKKDDWIVYYSPRTKLEGGNTVQAFVSIGKIASDTPYMAEVDDNFKPYRVNVNYKKSAKEASIRPLLNELQLTKERGKSWGLVFRRSKIKVDESDFKIIANAMKVDLI